MSWGGTAIEDHSNRLGVLEATVPSASSMAELSAAIKVLGVSVMQLGSTVEKSSDQYEADYRNIMDMIHDTRRKVDVIESRLAERPGR